MRDAYVDAEHKTRSAENVNVPKNSAILLGEAGTVRRKAMRGAQSIHWESHVC